jgi:hypothetical protein
MIFFFQGVTLPTSTGVFQGMQAAAAALVSKQRVNFNPIQVKNQVPFWLNDSQSLMVEFVQNYYNWLTNSYGYTGINVMDLSNLPDIEETPDFLIPNFLKMYAPDMLGIYNIGATYQPTPDQIRNTIHNIKTEIYQRKSNEDAFRAMMVSLFGISADTIKITYPKRQILRLNAGRLDWMPNDDYYGITGEYSSERYTMIGSHLNQGVLPDSGMWQDFSYILASEIDDSNPYYEAVVKETLHPAGLLGLYEKIEKYSEGGYYPGPVATVEVPKIANYYPYTLGSISSLPICSGCTGNLFVSGWTFPTFVYPSWSDAIVASGYTRPFGEIKLSDFLYQLTTTATGGSPNDRIGTNCNVSCGATGTIDFTWTVYRTSIAYVGITGINVGEAINFENNSAYGFNRYLWQFGDGTTTDIEHPTKSYSSVGTFGVTLTGFKDSISYQLSQKITSFIVS